MHKQIMGGLIVLLVISMAQATIYVTNENVTATDDSLNITEGMNVTGNFLMYNTTLINETLNNNESGEVIQFWPVIFNISNNESQPISQVNLSINNTAFGWQENATPDVSGEYATNLSARSWSLNTLTKHNNTVAYYRGDTTLYTHSFNVSGFQYINVTLNWFLLIGGTLFLVGVTGLLFLTTNTQLGLKHRGVLEPLALVLTPWGCVLLAAMMNNVAEVASTSTNVQANLATAYITLVWTAGFITAYASVYYLHKLVVTSQMRSEDAKELY